MLLLLAPGASLAGRQAAAGVEGYLVHAPSPGDPTLVIEAGAESVVLRVNRQTDLEFSPPLPPGDTSGAVAALEVGRRALARYDRNSHLALGVGVSAGVEVLPVEGLLRATGPSNTVSIESPNPGNPEPQPPVEYALSDQTRLFVNNVPVEASELLPFLNERVSALQFAESQTLERLRVVLPVLGTRMGTIRSINPGARQLRVVLNTGAADLVLPSGLQIQFGDRTVPFSALQEGDLVRVTYGDTGPGLRLAVDLSLLHVLPRTATARLTEVDPAAGTITLTGPGPDTFQVLPDASVTLQLGDDAPQPVTLAELQVALPQFARIKVKVEFLVRGKTRLATRVTAAVVSLGPPNPTSTR
jgi:hypothetical protein